MPAEGWREPRAAYIDKGCDLRLVTLWNRVVTYSGMPVLGMNVAQEDQSEILDDK